jgi:hypothetical protein
MGKRHKWANEIIAWSEGAEIEFRAKLFGNKWAGWLDDDKPDWHNEDYEFRIKPQPTHEDIMKEHYREMAKKALDIPEISEAVDRLFEAFAEKEPQYLYVLFSQHSGKFELSQVPIECHPKNAFTYIGKIKLEQDDE